MAARVIVRLLAVWWGSRVALFASMRCHYARGGGPVVHQGPSCLDACVCVETGVRWWRVLYVGPEVPWLNAEAGVSKIVSLSEETTASQLHPFASCGAHCVRLLRTTSLFVNLDVVYGWNVTPNQIVGSVCR